MRLYHYKIIPFAFLVSIINSTSELPFTPFFELAFILLLFEMLYEVSLRLPRYVGLATSIVGALILGETGVRAGLLSAPGVMIIAMSVISIHIVPDQANQISLLRVIFFLIGGMFGIYGIIAGFVYIIYYINTLNGYGAPYLAPIAPCVDPDTKDGIFKSNIYNMRYRPKSFVNKNEKRRDNGKN
jgi:spore germination protein KA